MPEPDQDEQPHHLAELLEMLLKDGRWTSVEYVGSGGTGLVYKATQSSSGRSVALKALRPSLATRPILSRDGTRLGSFSELFQKELGIAAGLDHPALMPILDCGQVALPSGGAIPYFAMPFRDKGNGAGDLYDYMASRPWESEDQALSWLVAALRQVALALAHMHSQDPRVLHGDVKGDNILVDVHGFAQVTDFGSAKVVRPGVQPTPAPGDERYFHPKKAALTTAASSMPARAMVEVPRDLLVKYGVAFDLYALGVTVERIRQGLMTRFTSSELPSLSILARRLQSAGTEERPRYDSAEALADDLPRLDPLAAISAFVPELAPIPRHVIRLAPELTVSLGSGLGPVLDSPLMRRLRNVKQLALVDELYPSAIHTRFEHSLGVYHWTQRYLVALWHDPANAYVRQVARPSDLRVALLAALLHDLGQYPFAHAAEGVDKIGFSHEAVGRTLLAPRGDVPFTLGRANVMYADWLAAEVRRSFPDITFEDIGSVLTNLPPQGPQQIDDHLHDVFGHILSGPIDADKADYLRRDALFTGIGGVSSVTDELFLKALTLNTTTRRLALRPGGRDAAERLLYLRYRLFKWVYWHRTVRGIEAVLAQVIYSLLIKHGEAWPSTFISEVLFMDENQTLSWLAEATRVAALGPEFGEALEGIASRRLYQRVLTISPNRVPHDPEHHRYKELYSAMTRKKNAWYEQKLRKELDVPMETFREEIARAVGLRRCGPVDVVVDIPIAKRHDVGDLQIMEEGGPENITIGSHVWRSVGDDFEEVARRIRVFVAPWLADRVSREAVLDALAKAFNIQ